MAFNFNWSPLIADTSRARDMLTTALNKSPKPPIIVDDIIVTELNLGSVPPELEILEIGDLADDRFRGIFKLCYTGDAYLTLKTRVQANPLNTYLSEKPSFASPQPLAASSGLTIPLQITLSDIRLSGFVILVFSRQKGITLVFRNDPLESLKVSSTFDSIPFVRDYLQKEIEGQLRVLFMEDLPAIIHRLSLRLWSSEYNGPDAESVQEPSDDSRNDELPVDPLASPPLDACDAFGRRLDDTELSSLSLDNGAETHATFSQKNLLRLATLNDSHRTLALFTPTIRDAVFRAWAGAAERGELTGTSTPSINLSTVSRHQSPTSSISSSVYSFTDGSAAGPPRPSTLSAMHSTYSSTSSNVHGRSRVHGTRQRKNRVIDLRRQATSAPEEPSDVSSRSSTPTPSLTLSSQGATGNSSEEREGELTTPPMSPVKVKIDVRTEEELQEIHSPRPHIGASKKIPRAMDTDAIHDGSSTETMSGAQERPQPSRPVGSRRTRDPSLTMPQLQVRVGEKQGPFLDGFAPLRFSPSTQSLVNSPTSTGGILEQAWMMKMATEIARKVRTEKEAAAAAASGRFWDSAADRERAGDESPPPAYVA